VGLLSLLVIAKMKTLRACKPLGYLQILFSELYYIIIFIIWPVAETVSVVFAVAGSETSFVWSIDEVVVSGKTDDWFESVHCAIAGLYYWSTSRC